MQHWHISMGCRRVHREDGGENNRMRKMIHLLAIVQPCDESSAVHELQPEVPSLTQPNGLGNLRRRARGAEAQSRNGSTWWQCLHEQVEQQLSWWKTLYSVGTPLSQSGPRVVFKGFSYYSCTLSSGETMSGWCHFISVTSGEGYRLVYGVHVTVHCLRMDQEKTRFRTLTDRTWCRHLSGTMWSHQISLKLEG